MLELSHIDKYYNPGSVNEMCLFQDFNLTIPDSQFVSVVGSNGSGKTSMLNLICGSISADAGKVIVNGTDITGQKEYMRHRKIGRVYQNPSAGTCPNMTVLENMAVADLKEKGYGLNRCVRKSRENAYREMLSGLWRETGGRMAYITSWYWNKGDFRKVNEDSFTLQRVRARKKELIFAAVCDGIGGLRAGECASGLVAEQLTEWFYREGFWKMRSLFWTKRMKKRALDALLDMQEKLERCEREEKICSGTTVTMVFVRGRRFVLVHLGDSRAYQLCRKRCLNREKQTGTRQLSQDHEEGGVLRRCVGAFGLEVPQLYTGTLGDGDMLLLCTDGFYKKAPPDFFRICLYEEREAGQLYRRLKGIGSFLTAQGEKDNMTAVLIGYEKEESVWKKNEKSVKNTF